MSNKQYYAILTPTIILGLLLIINFPSSEMYVMSALILFSCYASWKDLRKRALEADGEEEIRRAITPFILLVMIFVLFVVSILD
ncbi:hypothetical protein ACFFGV_15175 [Pontibacillus salicampi]|uniref:Uncharacterized protein n=1 Tax=Pontibacillus salicampi TaxID=1449801 RepID=A0ABV6LR85_9BACI